MSFDLLERKFVSRLAASRFYPKAARIFTLAAFVLLIAGGLAAPHVSSGMTGTLRNTNLASLIVWSLWWPLVIIGAVVLGRIWCQVCPMEMVNSKAASVGRKKPVPRFLKSGWGTAAFYILALVGFIRTFWAHRYPERMSIFFLFLLAAALIAGFLYEKRAFCGYLCPVGRILGLYAGCSILEWRVRDRSVCEACRTKDCVDGCGSGLYPPSILTNRDCLDCTHCLKVCPSKNFRWSLRRPMADFFTGLKMSALDVFLLTIVSGLVVYELAEEWSPARKVLEFLPAAINAGLGFSGEAANFVQALVLFVIYPGLLFLLPGLVGMRLNRTTLLESVKTFGLLFLPLAALGHLVKATIRIVSRLPYYPLAVQDPVGLETAKAIAAGTLKTNGKIVEALAPWVSGLSILAMAFALVSLGMIARKSPVLQSFGKRGRISHAAFAALYGAALLAGLILARF